MFCNSVNLCVLVRFSWKELELVGSLLRWE